MALTTRTSMLWIACAILHTGCTVENAPVAGARLAVVVAAGRVELATGAPITLNAHPSAGRAAPSDVRWTFTDSTGSVTASGAASDPRLVHFDRVFGDPIKGVLRAGAGSLTVEVPDVEGILQIIDANDIVLGSLHHTPLRGVAFSAARGDGKSDINFETDLIGPPILVAGDGATSHRINLMMVPEGYTSAELPKFHDDVSRMVEAMLDSDGYRDHRGEINVWSQDIKSAESGITDPGNGPARNTAFNITFGNGQDLPRRCLMPGTSWSAVSAANVARLAALKTADAMIVVANIDELGGCADAVGHFLVLSRDVDAAREGDVLAHELGHSLFHLGDEYAEAGQPCVTDAPNLTTSLDAIPWRDLIDTATPIPTLPGGPAGLIGAFEGGGQCEHGVFRAQETCAMRELGADFCAVCRRELARTFEQRATAIAHATITNRTGNTIWLMCDGPFATSSCSGWTEVAADASVDLSLSTGRFLLDTSTVPDPPVHWQQLRQVAPSEAFDIFSNEADPFTPAPPP